MKKLNVAIVGYGNLGKALEELLLIDPRYNLKYIFSRRSILAKVPVISYDKIVEYQDQIDILFMCGGSKSDTENQVLNCCRYFNTIDSFDNHNHIPIYTKNLNALAKKHKHTCISCCGWDPGLFSIMRVLFNSIENNAYTFWGKGISQGHSQAVRNIPNVQDAIQYTLPNKNIIKQIKNNIIPAANTKDLHLRLCYVYAKQNHQKIKTSIITMPDYFEGYKTRVKFVSKKVIDKHKKLYHSGQVLTLGDTMNFKVKIDSNPHFTAKIMIAYAISLHNLYTNKQYGCFTPLDIPPKMLDKNCVKYI